MRTFIAVELPDEVRKNIIELINELKEVKSEVKWVEEKNLHLTLKFLGWVEDQKIEEVIRLTQEAVKEKGRFKIKLEDLGTFPSGKSPRVIWVGVTEGKEKLINLAESLEKLFTQAGFRSEEREFSAHVTIGRIKEKKGVDKLKEKIESYKRPFFGVAVVDHLQIMKSTLTPKGPIYEIIKEVKL
jgi:2'-5' RNA ligase